MARKIQWSPVLAMSDEEFQRLTANYNPGEIQAPRFLQNEAYTQPAPVVPVAENQITPLSLPEYADAVQQPVTDLLQPLPKSLPTTVPLKSNWFEAKKNPKGAMGAFDAPPDNTFVSKILFAENSHPYAVSEAGARSDMQVIPDTAFQPGYGIKPLTKEEFEDTHKVSQFGKKYAGAMLKEFNGDEGLAALAYNQGAGYVKQVLKDLREGKPVKLKEEGQKYLYKLQPYLDKDYSYLYPDIQKQNMLAAYRQNR